MAKKSAALPLMPADVARRLLLDGLGLGADPARRATPSAVRRVVEQMGFVQVDTINSVERAHHHILASRLDGYRPAHLARLIERDRSLFEHWTHDAAVIPSAWLRYWRPRFDWFRKRVAAPGTRSYARMGEDPSRVLREVRRRIRREGPLRSRDFEGGANVRGDWWDWKPHKVALEVLWRTGELAITRRESFQKVYDLFERAYPDHDPRNRATAAELRDWVGTETLARLGTATPRELAGYLSLMDLGTADAWCRRAARAGSIVAVQVAAADGSEPRAAFALPDWTRRARRTPGPPERTRLLNPFDPTLRDRDRTRRLFGFEYTLEVFVPAAKRRYGYYVMPILEGERLVGRLEPKLHRDRDLLEIRKLWWEPGARPTVKRKRALREALDLFASQIGASRWNVPLGAL